MKGQKPLYHISFSGGRTSAYMTKLLIDNWSHKYQFIVTFANTGMEHPKTLEFIHNCDTHFGFNTVWLEAVVFEARKATGHKVVDFKTASRNGEPYEAVIRKYGIPNISYPHCTRELKINPMNSYLRELGIDYRSIPTAIGIRDDERRRVSKTAGVHRIEYPLIDVWPTDKQDVLEWWAKQKFDLEIEEFEGNCLGCYKKSMVKHFKQIEKNPGVYDFYRRMEDEYKSVGSQVGDRVFFRGNTDTRTLFRLYEMNKGLPVRNLAEQSDSGCSESCEVFETVIEES